MSNTDSSIRYEVRYFGINTYNYLNPEYTCSKFESNNYEDITCDREAKLRMTKDVWGIMTLLSITEARIRGVRLQS